MASITPASGGTITASTLEAFFVASIRRLQAMEKSPVYNPNNANNCTSTSSDDSSSFTATIAFPVSITTDGDGSAVRAVDYLTNSTGYNAGTGGTITSPTLVEAIFESALRICALQIQPIKNPANLNPVSWNMSNSENGATNQANISISVQNFPLEIVNGGDSQTTKGKEYLL